MLTLDQIACGKTAAIIELRSEGAVRRRLLDLGLTPKTAVMVRKVAPMGDPIEISLRGYELTIRLEDARKIVVSEVEV
jgi:Fe2+ transport system protein FeoA